MPRIVNHDERRQQVARVARELILRSGIDKVTVREIAGRAGYSTAVVSHYFRDKKELMFLVFTDTQRSAEARFRAAIDAEGTILKGLEALLPRDEESRDFWRVWFAFWSMTLVYDDFRREQVVQARKTVDMIAELLTRAGVDAGDEEERLVQCQRLFAVVSGIAVQAIHDPRYWPLRRQRVILQDELKSLGCL